ncbi:MAG TPA: hypothetical protein HPP87_01750 [Planctomycetes bacterium]|nr:hypothetical protein [Planctomycetota bacterium]HIJ70070.1 hypothetical protein [Planctomycetota bacterium]
MTENRENLDELLSRFFDEGKTHEAAEEIRAGEKLLASFSAPVCDQAVINNIKAKIRLQLKARKRRQLVRSVFDRVAVAAVIIVLAIAGVRFFPASENRQTTTSKSGVDFNWDDQSVGNGYEQFAALTDQIEEIESSILAIRLGEYEAGSSMILTDLEAEMSEINGDFWKG